MRGRLIFPFVAEFGRLDAAAMRHTLSYDPDFHEARAVDRNNDGLGEAIRWEHAPIRVPCQVEAKIFEELRMLASGNSPRSRVELTLHFRDLERLGLVHTTSGEAKFCVGDRLHAIYDRSGHLVQKTQNPGLFVTETRPLGFGLNRIRPTRNLLLVVLENRPQGVRRSV